jgi:hypothetical protein
MSEPAIQELHKPASQELSEPAIQELHEPVSQELPEPASQEWSEPASQELPEPATVKNCMSQLVKNCLSQLVKNCLSQLVKNCLSQLASQDRSVCTQEDCLYRNTSVCVCLCTVSAVQKYLHYLLGCYFARRKQEKDILHALSNSVHPAPLYCLQVHIQKCSSSYCACRSPYMDCLLANFSDCWSVLLPCGQA